MNRRNIDRLRVWLWLALLLPGLALLLPAGRAQDDPARALLLELEGVIGPASSGFVLKGLEQARAQGAPLVVLRMNTPGGLDSSMREIIQAILASEVPVATWVAPGGARAASAGTYILYASHIAAMAPATNLGAATPVQVGGPGPGGGQGDGRDDGQGSEADDPDKDSTDDGETRDPAKIRATPGDTAMERKMINDARAYIRSLAQLRGRNIEWAEQAVTEAASLSAAEALDRNVIDLSAASVEELLEKADGRVVEAGGTQRLLSLSGVGVEVVSPDWRDRLLAVITHPQVAYILMLVGIYGLFFELYNPGALVPGVLGGICLLLALFAFQVLPVNYAGVALIVLGAAFMIAETLLPSFGILGIGGVVAFVAGSLMLWDETQVGYELPLGLILGLALFSAVLFIGTGAYWLRLRRRPPVSGGEGLIGAEGVVEEAFGPGSKGWVRLPGERWQALSDRPLKPGQAVRVVGRDGLVLNVRPQQEEEPSGDL